MSTTKELDIVVYGATGFTGRLVAEHMAQQFGSRNIRWAMAGRDAKKLESVRSELGTAEDVAIIVADTNDRAALTAMAERTKIVVTTVGPYQLYGSELVAVCAAAGTDCLNLTGESHWMRAMIDAHDEAAKRSGARILHSCGFDSIPFELGVYFTQGIARQRLGHPATHVKGRVRGLNGSLSGGTVLSGSTTRAAAQKNPDMVKLLVDPFALTPGFRGPDQPRGDKPYQDEDTGTEVAPFMMAAINSKNVHRSNLLQGHAYGTDFAYDEMMMVTQGNQADFTLPTGASSPKPGEGPDKNERENGFYDILFVGIDRDGKRVRASVYGKKDPGYGSTSMILAETAACLLQNRDQTKPGISLPGAMLGQKLVDQLQAHAGLTFKDETV